VIGRITNEPHAVKVGQGVIEEGNVDVADYGCHKTVVHISMYCRGSGRKRVDRHACAEKQPECCICLKLNLAVIKLVTGNDSVMIGLYGYDQALAEFARHLGTLTLKGGRWIIVKWELTSCLATVLPRNHLARRKC
jgi:hypothetical protein